ncbi:MAG: GatB/YqeY domain-containing protein [Bacilli bacterium]|nr:GatB/YqeY domain-containing protein [Bacilli bacterium]
MMLIDELKKANMLALKEHNVEARASLSIVIARYTELKTSGAGIDPTDDDVIKIIMKVGKELDEEKASFLQAGRHEQAEAIERQKSAIAAFLPKQLSEEEIRKIIVDLPDKSIPVVMKYFKTNYGSKVDMGLVSKVLKSL